MSTHKLPDICPEHLRKLVSEGYTYRTATLTEVGNYEQHKEKDIRFLVLGVKLGYGRPIVIWKVSK